MKILFGPVIRGRNRPEMREERSGNIWIRCAKPVEREDYAGAEEMLEEHLLGEFTESYLPMGSLVCRYSGSDECGFENARK